MVATRPSRLRPNHHSGQYFSLSYRNASQKKATQPKFKPSNQSTKKINDSLEVWLRISNVDPLSYGLRLCAPFYMGHLRIFNPCNFGEVRPIHLSHKAQIITLLHSHDQGPPARGVGRRSYPCLGWKKATHATYCSNSPSAKHFLRLPHYPASLGTPASSAPAGASSWSFRPWQTGNPFAFRSIKLTKMYHRQSGWDLEMR